jgi:hypothetical protein
MLQLQLLSKAVHEHLLLLCTHELATKSSIADLQAAMSTEDSLLDIVSNSDRIIWERNRKLTLFAPKPTKLNSCVHYTPAPQKTIVPPKYSHRHVASQSLSKNLVVSSLSREQEGGVRVSFHYAIVILAAVGTVSLKVERMCVWSQQPNDGYMII